MRILEELLHKIIRLQDEVIALQMVTLELIMRLEKDKQTDVIMVQ